MLTATAGFKAALTQSHAGHVRITAYYRAADNTRTTLAVLSSSGGTLTIDSDGAYWRTADFRVANEVVDSTGLKVVDLVDAKSTDVVIEFGVTVAGSIEWVTAATLRVDKVELSRSGAEVSIVATDEGSRLSRDPLVAPWPNVTEPEALTPSRGMIATIQKFVNDTYPADDPTWIISDELDSRSSWAWREGLVWQGDRWTQIKSLADALGGWIYNDQLGRWCGAKFPALVSTPVAYYKSGDYEVLENSTSADDRDSIYNVVYVRYEHPADGSSVAVAEDTDPASPTYIGGPYGRQVKEITNDVVANETDAQDVADELLSQFLYSGTLLEVSSVWNPLMIPGDHVEVELPDGTLAQHIVKRIVLPWPVGKMQLGTRLADPGGES